MVWNVFFKNSKKELGDCLALSFSEADGMMAKQANRILGYSERRCQVEVGNCCLTSHVRLLEGNTTFLRACSRKNPSDRWESIQGELQSLSDLWKVCQTKEFKKLKAKRTLKGNLSSVCKFFMARRFQIVKDCTKRKISSTWKI